MRPSCFAFGAAVAAVLLLLFVSTSSGAVLPASPIPRGWKRAASQVMPPELKERPLSMTLALRRRNMEALEKTFWEVSDPSHERYGEHLTHEEMRELVSPGPAALHAVTEWLAAHGIASYTVSRHEDSIAFDASQAQVARLLGVRFEVFEHAETKERVAKALGAMTLPEAVATAVEVVAGHRGFPLPKRAMRRQGKPSVLPAKPLSGVANVSVNVTPAVLYSAYNVSVFPVTPAGRTNIQSFFEAQGQFVNQTDLTSFCTGLVPALSPVCKIAQYVGQNIGSEPGAQSSLDSEYLIAMGGGAETWVWSYANFDFCGDLMRWAQDVFSAGKNGTYPFVVSMSYGAQVLPTICGSDVARLSKDMMKMGAMGVTVVIESGDSGSGEIDGLLATSMPASLPYCTSVGATTFVQGNNGTQRAASYSGGGFSFDIPQPSYQSVAAAAFFAQHHKLPPATSYNASGRGTPDVSVLGDNYYFVTGGSWVSATGTPATFAGLVTLLNNVRLRVGKTMGFLNPFLYQNPQGFTDITLGNNDVNQDGYGWYAVPGWDPVSGLGTPNFGRLADAVERLNAADVAKRQPANGGQRATVGKASLV